MKRRQILATLAAVASLPALSQPRARLVDVVADCGADATGKTSSIAAFQKAMTMVQDMGGGKVRIPAGTYFFPLRGDADTIQPPSGCDIECARGVTFKWGHWGSPLFAIVNRRQVKLAMNGATFLYTGTYARTAGARDAFGYGTAIPAYEWCTHIIVMGSDNVTIEDVRCAGETTGNVQNAFIQIGGKADGSLTTGNVVRNVYADDVCQVLLFACQQRFRFENLEFGRYSNVSAGLYGPGHVIYATQGQTPSTDGVISGIVDRGIALGPYSAGAASVSLKNVVRTTVRGLQSQRAEGVLSVRDCEDVDIDLQYRNASTERDTNVGLIYFIEPTRINQRIKIRGSIVMEALRNTIVVNMAGTSVASKNLDCELDLAITADGGENVASIAWVGSRGKAKIAYRSRTAGKAPVLVYIDRGSEDNSFDVRVAPGSSTPRVALGERGVNRGNQVACDNASSLRFDQRGFSSPEGNSVSCRAG